MYLCCIVITSETIIYTMDQYITRIALTGKRDNIIRVLNAAIRNVGIGELIAESDDPKTISSKLTDAEGKGIGIGISDLLAPEFLKDELLVQKKTQFEQDCEDEMYDEAITGRAIEFVKVEASGDDYTAKFSLYEFEDSYYADYADWDDIARLYKCRIFLDTESYWNGQFDRFEQAVILDPGSDGVKATVLKSGKTEEEYDSFYEQLVALCPERYLPAQKQYFKEKADKQEYKDLTEKQGIAINHKMWQRFTSWEGDNSAETLRKVFEVAINETIHNRESITQEDFATVLRLRAEKWQGVNDEFAACYASLLTELPEVWEREMQEFQAANAKKQEEQQSYVSDEDELPF